MKTLALVFSYIVFSCLDIPVKHSLSLFIYYIYSIVFVIAIIGYKVILLPYLVRGDVFTKSYSYISYRMVSSTIWIKHARVSFSKSIQIARARRTSAI